MIKVTELRIGNKVKCSISNDAGIYEVLAIPAWGMDGCGDGKEPLVIIDRCPKQSVPESKLKPIPISPEVLIQYGFTDEKDGWFKIGIYWMKSIGDAYYGFCEFYQGQYVIVRHLHHLQNLYFVLTNQELEYQGEKVERSVASKD